MVFNELFMQFQSDILNVPVIRPKISETTALGAAYAAGLAVGYWGSYDELKNKWEIDRTWHPIMAPGTRDDLYSRWKKAVTHTFNWMED
jgi:glycerol kinase